MSADDVTFSDAPTPPAVAALAPLSARQMRLALLGLGVTREQVASAIAAIPGATEREEALIEWEYSTSYERHHPLIGQIGAAVGLDAAEIDAAWTAALAR